MTGSLDELTPLFFQPHFFIWLGINLIICIGINIGLDIWAMSNQSGSKYYVISGSNIANMLIFSIIVSFFMFWNAKRQHDRIKAGEASPVTRRALCDNCFKKVICFSMQEPIWKKRIWLFMWNAFLFPGVFTVMAMSLLCMAATGFDSLGKAEACEVSAPVNIVVIECWKAVGLTIVFSMMYASSHNEEQPELADVINPLIMNGDSSSGGVEAVSTGGALGSTSDDIYNTAT